LETRLKIPSIAKLTPFLLCSWYSSFYKGSSSEDLAQTRGAQSGSILLHFPLAHPPLFTVILDV
jgi:hypothetical protein